MTYLFKIIPSLSLMFERWEGRITGEDAWAAVQTSAKHLDYRPGLDVVADFTDAQLELTYAEMRSFVSRVEADRQFDTRRIALIVARPLEMGMIRMFGMLSEGSGHWKDLRICSTFAEARKWLDLSESIELPPLEEMTGNG